MVYCKHWWKELGNLEVEIHTDAQLAEPIINLTVPVDYPDRDALVAALQALSVTPTGLTVTQQDQTIQLPLTAVIFIEAAGHLVMVHTIDQAYRINQSLTSLSETLPANFSRISKSAIVNRTAIYALSKTLTGNLLTFNQSHKQLYVSRRYVQPLKLALERDHHLWKHVGFGAASLF